MREPYDRLFIALREMVKEILAQHPECHGLEHTARVWHNARRIALVEGADAAVVEFAAWLHDIGRVEEFADNGVSCHARIGAERVPQLLARLGVTDENFVKHVAACVLTHRYRKRESRPPQTLEARVVFDADKLDSMGAIGIGRAFHFAGLVGARVHNSEEEALGGASYGLQDTAYREYLVKMRYLGKALLTAEGRRLGKARQAYMHEFFDRLNAETEGGEGGD